ncbi:MAG TPA: ATP-binding protein [Bryobacteraceae bacterium]|nr:ATP-binding protein [Bryobacteraceae bacterium]
MRLPRVKADASPVRGSAVAGPAASSAQPGDRSTNALRTGSYYCQCERVRHDTKLVVLTGGPGGGKTAVLEMARRYFCPHVAIAPEAASIVFSGGFPRTTTKEGRRAAQRAIFHIQREIEAIALADRKTAVVLCDRGTLDGLAYWPGSRQSFLDEFGVDFEEERNRYSAVIHVEVPALAWGYENNRIRNESVDQAQKIDRRVARAWRGHPRFMNVGAQAGFLDKLACAIELLRGQLPPCCQTPLHALANNSGTSIPAA